MHAPEKSPAPALDLIRSLAGGIGPRRPCSPAEEAAANEIVSWLAERDVTASVEGFRGYASFGYPYALMFGAVLAGDLLERAGKRTAGDTLSVTALVALALEGDLRITPVSDLLSRQPSRNVVARVAAAREPRQRICLCAHMDTTRSGLMFAARVAPHLPWLLRITGLSTLLVAARPLVRRLPGGTVLTTLGRFGLAFALAMLAQREALGKDVPGANDNASGCGVAAQLLAECARRPLPHTEVDLLITGCEESGLLGAQAYLRTRPGRTAGTVFLNFDTVGGDAPLTYILREPAPVVRPATPRLVKLMEEIAADRPDLGLEPASSTAGLPTDATVMLARGYEGITLLAQGRTIPNYHQPTDTVENLAPETVECAVAVGRELLARLDATV
jgi:hypothetical protein